MPIKNIGLKDESYPMGKIIDRYCEEVGDVPTEVAKQYLHGFNFKVPPKFIRQLLFAGMFFALEHSDDLIRW